MPGGPPRQRADPLHELHYGAVLHAAYDGVDPNPIMAPFFIFFFGMMMADMGYGLAMIVGSLLFLKKKRPDNRSFMEMIFWCGIMTFIFGALTGRLSGGLYPPAVQAHRPPPAPLPCRRCSTR